MSHRLRHFVYNFALEFVTLLAGESCIRDLLSMDRFEGSCLDGVSHHSLIGGIFMHGPLGFSFSDFGLTFFFINVECFSITFADYGHRKS
jgi:hypothetical protein